MSRRFRDESSAQFWDIMSRAVAYDGLDGRCALCSSERLDDSPVYMVIRRPAAALHDAHERELADFQVRAQLRRRGDEARIAKFYAISCFGREHVAFYTYDCATGAIQPPETTGNVPVSRWSTDTTKDEGRAELRKVYEDILSMVGDVAPPLPKGTYSSSCFPLVVGQLVDFDLHVDLRYYLVDSNYAKIGRFVWWIALLASLVHEFLRRRSPGEPVQ